MTGYRQPLRSGFTLIELLVVMAIIAILAGLGLSAVQNFRERAKVAGARADISGLDTAIGSFKSSFPQANRIPATGGNTVPMASVTKFRLRAHYPSTAAAAPLDVADTSLEAQFLKRMFPRMDLNPPAMPAGTASATYGTGLPNMDLDPNQVLVFFLGGYYLQVDSANVATERRQVWGQGYLNNPTSPFLHVGALTTQPARKPASFEFPSNRLLVNKDNVTMATLDEAPYLLLSGDEAPHFLDSWKTPYFYISSLGDNVYPATVPSISYKEQEAFTSVTLSARALKASANKYENAKTHQIISAGKNKLFGNGATGIWSSDSAYGDSADGSDDLVNFRVPALGSRN